MVLLQDLVLNTLRLEATIVLKVVVVSVLHGQANFLVVPRLRDLMLEFVSKFTLGKKRLRQIILRGNPLLCLR